VAVLINDAAEGNSYIAECNDDVAPDVRVFRCLQNLEEEPMVLVTELRAHAQELAE